MKNFWLTTMLDPLDRIDKKENWIKVVGKYQIIYMRLHLIVVKNWLRGEINERYQSIC